MSCNVSSRYCCYCKSKTGAYSIQIIVPEKYQYCYIFRQKHKQSTLITSTSIISIGLDKRGYQVNIFLTSRRKLMLSQWGASNEYPQHKFSSRNKKNIDTFWLKKAPYQELWSLTTAYLKVKLNMNNLTTGNKVLWKRGEIALSLLAISSLFHNIFNKSLASGVKLHIHLWNMAVQFIFSLILQFCLSRYGLSRSISESYFGLRDYTSQLYCELRCF